MGKNKQTENIRFSSQKYTQKPGFWLPRQILLVQMPAQIKTKAIGRRSDETVKLLLMGRYRSEIDGKQQSPARAAALHVAEAIVASATCSNPLCGCRCFTRGRRY